ncbi:hypothetical protein DBR26_15115 [Pseudomonas sp. HMWF007]|nr:hypothetical protein DBR26_15115 [Pseudomonas sp. HMWF007]
MAVKFITYSQNFEDLILHRALSDIDKGFYIDLGAAEPDTHSVTKAFYDRGWSGINVEPGSRPFARLVEQRNRDININSGIWSFDGNIPIYFVGDENELSTTNTWLMEQHKASGWEVREEIIPVTCLRTICSEYVKSSTVHFLKVDVEGAEIEAFNGHDFDQCRPWIILVESHEPGRKSKHWVEFDNRIISHGYKYVYCDAVNRFYISDEKYDDLIEHFSLPPNIYDNWVRAEEVEFEKRCVHAEKQMIKGWSELAEAQARVKVLEEQLAEAQARVKEFIG